MREIGYMTNPCAHFSEFLARFRSHVVGLELGLLACADNRCASDLCAVHTFLKFDFHVGIGVIIVRFPFSSYGVTVATLNFILGLPQVLRCMRGSFADGFCSVCD